MVNSTISIIIIGIILSIFSLLNALISTNVQQDLFRSEILSSISSLIILTIGLLFKQITPRASSKVEFSEKQGFKLNEKLDEELKEELAWGSSTILKATAAATILIYLKDETILRRGYISEEEFKPGKISKSCIDKRKLISLPNTKNYPGSYEFDSIVKTLPSIIISPIKTEGFIIIGGWSPRCFTKADEILIEAWGQKVAKYIN
tara:strand:- start:919 stop:1533 length:615 start_codon:yes stop_codon:yes gene_type:complete